MEHETLGGSKVVKELTVMHAGWECDDKMWVTEDGRLWWTSHGGSPHVVGVAELEHKIAEIQECLNALVAAHTDLVHQ